MAGLAGERAGAWLDPERRATIWRVLLVVLYGGAWALFAALHDGILEWEAPSPVLWLAAPVVGFMVGRWWAVFAVLGWLVGNFVGWDEQANYDRDRAIVFLFAPVFFAWIGGLLLVGVVVSRVRRTSRPPPGSV